MPVLAMANPRKVGLRPSNLDAALYFVRGSTGNAELQRFKLAVCGCEMSPLRLTKLAGSQGDGRRRGFVSV